MFRIETSMSKNRVVMAIQAITYAFSNPLLILLFNSHDSVYHALPKQHLFYKGKYCHFANRFKKRRTFEDEILARNSD